MLSLSWFSSFILELFLLGWIDSLSTKLCWLPLPFIIVLSLTCLDDVLLELEIMLLFNLLDLLNLLFIIILISYFMSTNFTFLHNNSTLNLDKSSIWLFWVIILSFLRVVDLHSFHKAVFGSHIQGISIFIDSDGVILNSIKLSIWLIYFRDLALGMIKLPYHEGSCDLLKRHDLKNSIFFVRIPYSNTFYFVFTYQTYLFLHICTPFLYFTIVINLETNNDYLIWFYVILYKVLLI